MLEEHVSVNKVSKGKLHFNPVKLDTYTWKLVRENSCTLHATNNSTHSYIKLSTFKMMIS